MNCRKENVSKLSWFTTPVHRSIYMTCSCTIWNDKEETTMQNRVHARHETVNKRMTDWNILKAPYQHDIFDHEAVFSAIAVLTQLYFENGEPFFWVEYKD